MFSIFRVPFFSFRLPHSFEQWEFHGKGANVAKSHFEKTHNFIKALTMIRQWLASWFLEHYKRLFLPHVIKLWIRNCLRIMRHSHITTVSSPYSLFTTHALKKVFINFFVCRQRFQPSVFLYTVPIYRCLLEVKKCYNCGVFGVLWYNCVT